MILATTTATVRRPVDGDPYETAVATVVAAGLPAHISAPGGNEIDQGGQLEQVTALLLAPAGTDLTHTDLVTDDSTDEQYRVAWVRERQGLGLDHIVAGLVAYDGGATGG